MRRRERIRLPFYFPPRGWFYVLQSVYGPFASEAEALSDMDNRKERERLASMFEEEQDA